MKTTIVAVLLSLTLCAYAQSIQVSSCDSGETNNCYQCVNSATADGSACGYCYKCVSSNDSASCFGQAPALNCTDACAVLDPTMYPNLNYYALNQSSAYLASPYSGSLGPAGSPRGFFTYVKTNLLSIAKTVDPFVNWSDDTCFDPTNPGSFFSTVDTTCDDILYTMRYNYHLTRCDGNIRACANSSHCNQIPDACAYVLDSGCLNSTIMNWCDMNDTMCNSEIQYQPLQQLCGSAPSVMSCEGALTLGCNVCNSTTGVVGTLTGTAQPVCPANNIFIPNSPAGIQTCESAPSEMCHDIDPTVASALPLVYPSGFQTRTSTCYNVPTPPPQVVSNNTNVTVQCVDKTYQCDLSVDCREAFFQLVYYTSYCKPCSAPGTQQLKVSQCAKLLACTPFIANCSMFAASANYYQSTVLPALCASDDNGLDLPPFRDIDALHAGCANAPPPTTSAVVTGSATAVVTGSASTGSQASGTSAGTTDVATNAGVTTTSGMASAGATTGGSTGMASTGSATGVGSTTTGVMMTSAGTTSGSATTTVRATTTSTPRATTGDSTRNVLSFAVVLTILACIYAL